MLHLFFRAVVCAAIVVAVAPQLSSQTPSERTGRVLLDEGHNNFHISTGGYAAYVRLLTQYGFVVNPLKGRISRVALAGYEVFISANGLAEPQGVLARKAQAAGETLAWATASARPAHSAEEIVALRDWVRDGGSLLLVTDHPPYSGASSQLAAAFGIAVTNSAASDSAFVGPTPRRQNAGHFEFTRSNTLLGDHPTLTGVDTVLTYAGTALSAPAGSAVLLRLPDSTVDRTWNEQQKQLEDVAAPGRAQGIALEYGKGRVVVLGEAGMLTANPGTNVDLCGDRAIAQADLGNRRFALNIARWLARKTVEVNPSGFVNTGCTARTGLTIHISAEGGPQTFAGTWQADMPGVIMTLELKLSGADVTGEMAMGEQKVKVEEGFVKGNQISFKVTAPNSGRVLRYIRTATDTEIAFVRTVQVREGGAPGGSANGASFVARRTD
jgi:hypothetical protein